MVVFTLAANVRRKANCSTNQRLFQLVSGGMGKFAQLCRLNAKCSYWTRLRLRPKALRCDENTHLVSRHPRRYMDRLNDDVSFDKALLDAYAMRGDHKETLSTCRCCQRRFHLPFLYPEKKWTCPAVLYQRQRIQIRSGLSGLGWAHGKAREYLPEEMPHSMCSPRCQHYSG